MLYVCSPVAEVSIVPEITTRSSLSLIVSVEPSVNVTVISYAEGSNVEPTFTSMLPSTFEMPRFTVTVIVLTMSAIGLPSASTPPESVTVIVAVPTFIPIMLPCCVTVTMLESEDSYENVPSVASEGTRTAPTDAVPPAVIVMLSLSLKSVYSLYSCHRLFVPSSS